MQVFVVGTTLAGSLATAFFVQRALLGILLDAMNAQRDVVGVTENRSTAATGTIR